MITGSPLEDARHLAQRYSRMRQEAEAQVILFIRKHLAYFLYRSLITRSFLLWIKSFDYIILNDLAKKTGCRGF